MKEVLTKRFWRDVKKTFIEARDGPPAVEAPPPQVAAPEGPSGDRLQTGGSARSPR
jgi:hypothetical protein